MRVFRDSALLILSLLASPLQAETIHIYSYHNHPPFVTGKGKGLTYELADILRREAGGEYSFEVKILPRPRLNTRIKHWISGQCQQQKCTDNWLIPWVNPKWGFIKGPRDNYLWHELFYDSSSVLSHTDNPIDYQGPASLIGKTIAGMRGHRYIGVDKLVAEGEIRRVDGNKERDNLMKVLMQRVDATLLPTSSANYFLRNDQSIKPSADKIILSDVKQQTFYRYIMLPETRQDLLDLVSQAEQETAGILDAYR